METDLNQPPPVSNNSNNSDPGGHDRDLSKMFIGGLSWQTTPDDLKNYFSQFGDIAEVMVMKDPTTKRSRGFGFVTFTDQKSLDDVLSHGPHELGGKKIDPKIAFPKSAHPKVSESFQCLFCLFCLAAFCLFLSPRGHSCCDVIHSRRSELGTYSQCLVSFHQRSTCPLYIGHTNAWRAISWKDCRETCRPSGARRSQEPTRRSPSLASSRSCLFI